MAPNPAEVSSPLQPRFTLASAQRRQLIRLLWIGAALLLLFVGGGVFPRATPVLVLWLAPAIALMLLMVGLLMAIAQCQWRLAHLHASAISTLDAETPAITVEHPGWRAKLVKLWLSTTTFCRRVIQAIHVDVWRALVLGVPALLVLLLIRVSWQWPGSAPPLAMGKVVYLIGALITVLSFFLLVLERQWANTSPDHWPEAEPLARLTRLVLLVMLIDAAAWLFLLSDSPWPLRWVMLSVLPCAVVAGEFALRALLSFFAPPEDTEPHWQADSLLLALLRWPPRPMQHLQDEMQRQFGIDLRQNWAFGFIRRTSLPLLGVLVVIAWLLTGLHEIPLAARGIYERFGNPVRVWQPGMHLGLPWPFGQVRVIENGVIHELAAALGSEDREEVTTPEPPPPAEGPAPDSANRLWDASHVAEKSQLIASHRSGKQSFEIVNMDVRFVYRIGLDDAAALAATYQQVDVPALIRRTASRQLVRTFASRTLDGVLGEQRSELARALAEAVQAELNRMNAGVDILAAMVEAIHPPAGAANAYHSVQAAQIHVQSMVARERGYAAEQLNTAQLQASVANNAAQGLAREVKASAQATELRFAAERKAYQSAGRAFLSELYLDQLSKGLANAQLIIMDHRLGSDAQAPTIDLRRFAPTNESVPR